MSHDQAAQGLNGRMVRVPEEVAMDGLEIDRRDRAQLRSGFHAGAVRPSRQSIDRMPFWAVSRLRDTALRKPPAELRTGYWQ